VDLEKEGRRLAREQEKKIPRKLSYEEPFMDRKRDPCLKGGSYPKEVAYYKNRRGKKVMPSA